MPTEPAAGATLEGRTIAGFEWAEADLTDATFVDCVIEDAQFSNTVLVGARFQKCRILRGRMAHADLREATFEDCLLTDADAHAGLSVAFSRLNEARFLRCDLSFARFDRSELYDVAMDDCNLRGARFDRADFSKSFGGKVVRVAAAFRRCNFHLAELGELGLSGCDLSGSRFREADLSGTNLEEADLKGCDLFGAILAGVKLAGADLRGAEISGLDLTALASREGLKITANQQYPLLAALGIDVHAD